MGKYYEDDSNDMNRAFSWFTKAAKRGFKEAEYKIAQIYLEGLVDGGKDIQKALKWFKRAANIKEEEKNVVLPFIHIMRKFLFLTKNMKKQ